MNNKKLITKEDYKDNLNRLLVNNKMNIDEATEKLNKKYIIIEE